MPLLDRTGLIDDIWSAAEPAAAGEAANPLVAWDALDAALAAKAPAGRVGIVVGNATSAEAIMAHAAIPALIVIVFPTFADGRGFSLARQLRARGFAGRLRARGPLIADQFRYALACGFDEIELPEASFARQPAAQWLAALDGPGLAYQRGYGDHSILERRRAAREAAHA